MRLRPAGEDGETEGQDRKGENTQEEEVDTFVRQRSLREGARGIFATAPSASTQTSSEMYPRARFEPVGPVLLKKGTSRGAKFPLSIAMVPKKGLDCLSLRDHAIGMGGAGFPTTPREGTRPLLFRTLRLPFSGRAAPPLIRSGAVRSRKEPHAVSNDEERHPHVRSDAHPKGD